MKLVTEILGGPQAETVKEVLMLKTRRVNKSIEDIVIVESYAKTKPSADKIRERYAEWLRTGVVPGEILIDKYNRLFDGYAAYLVHRMIGTKNVECLRVTGNMEEQKEKDLEKENQKLQAECDKLHAEIDKLQEKNSLLKESFDRLARSTRFLLWGNE